MRQYRNNTKISCNVLHGENTKLSFLRYVNPYSTKEFNHILPMHEEIKHNLPDKFSSGTSLGKEKKMLAKMLAVKCLVKGQQALESDPKNYLGRVILK